MQDNYLFNITQLGEAFGLHRDTVRKRLVSANVKANSVKKNTALYHIKDVAEAILEKSSSSVSAQDPDSMKPGERKAWFDSENARLNYKKECGELCESHDVARKFADVFKAIANTLDSLPDLLERKANLTPDQAEQIQKQTDNMRENLFLAVVNNGADIE
ncbi:MAG: DUF1441 family protein [Cognaticolwellia aestuarii]